MERYYVMIDAGKTIDHNTKFFSVVVGSSARCQKHLQWLRLYCWQHNIYFAIRSRETDIFMLRIAESLGTKLHYIPKLEVKVSPLVAHIKNHNSTPSMPPVTASAVSLRQKTDPKFFLLCNTSSRKRLTYKT